MPKKPEEEIQLKLAQLEASIGDTASQPPAAPVKKTDVAVVRTQKEEAEKSDFQLIVGFCLMALGMLLFFNHVHIGSSFMGMFGLGGTGTALIIIPLMIGIGMLFFDYKNRLAWGVTAACLAVLIFSVLSSLVITFPGMTLLSLVIMLVPFSLGGAFVAKGLKAREAGKR
jgi:hypothetical protein